MEFFNKTKVVRLRSHLEKYLYAENDEETVRQSRNGTSRKAQWTIELVEGNSHVIHLKSCFGKYLTASDEPYLLGLTGNKVLLTDPIHYYDNSIEWEPRTDGFQVKLKAKSGGKYLRANGATLPWRNSITHDIPYRTATQYCILWDVEAVDDYINLIEDYSLPGSLSPTWSNSSSVSECSDTDSPSILSSLGSWFANEKQV